MIKRPRGFYERTGKRIFDIAAAGTALVTLSPLLAILAVMVRVKHGKPVLFTQLRPGKNEQLFPMYKFRTMTEERDANGELLDDYVRLTPFGENLRATSLDELPELINILKGDMSVVGPRPLLPDYLPYYTAAEHRRHEVRPGLTGRAQISGRNGLSWGERFAEDIAYINNITFANDIKIILATLRKVIAKDGVNISCLDNEKDRLDEHRKHPIRSTGGDN
ncbi:sugar transferase [Salisediminibacterium halotolerans]|uniref:Sugar transferase involved in LPS biosynthesis (Colanic, teichoic acid) n=1 Tax=Salisediminibacterium halotolerans TaxID=517425 RepID=A0A1H9QIL1_9BACI|nr:sugar transferase [Salisediminibacterium haloalkalitolerans]SER60268.1 Sugar transferase involved in LPS biosynthesis (colanic, teichoic acid) [Salisediminibacterium haloalkalitolerans]